MQENNLEAKELRNKDLLEGLKDMEIILQHQGFLYVSKIICFEMISHYHDNILVEYCGIKKTRELIDRKYF